VLDQLRAGGVVWASRGAKVAQFCRCASLNCLRASILARSLHYLPRAHSGHKRRHLCDQDFIRFFPVLFWHCSFSEPQRFTRRRHGCHAFRTAGPGADRQYRRAAAVMAVLETTMTTAATRLWFA
jgi:hypothetical protein